MLCPHFKFTSQACGILESITLQGHESNRHYLVITKTIQLMLDFNLNHSQSFFGLQSTFIKFGFAISKSLMSSIIITRSLVIIKISACASY